MCSEIQAAFGMTETGFRWNSSCWQSLRTIRKHKEKTQISLALSHFFLKWHGNKCGKNKSNENFKTTNPSHNKDRPKTTGECEVF
jgi:hypothetical protein